MYVCMYKFPKRINNVQKNGRIAPPYLQTLKTSKQGKKKKKEQERAGPQTKQPSAQAGPTKKWIPQAGLAKSPQKDKKAKNKTQWAEFTFLFQSFTHFYLWICKLNNHSLIWLLFVISFHRVLSILHFFKIPLHLSRSCYFTDTIWFGLNWLHLTWSRSMVYFSSPFQGKSL